MFSGADCRVYRVNVKVVSGDERFEDSPMSNTLTVNESTTDADSNRGRGGVLGGLATSISWPYDDSVDDDDDDGVAVRVIRLTESAIHLDWSEYQAPLSLVYYRVVWASTSNHAVCWHSAMVSFKICFPNSYWIAVDLKLCCFAIVMHKNKNKCNRRINYDLA